MKNMNGWLRPDGIFIDFEDEKHCAWCDKEISDECNFNILKCKMFASGHIKLSEGKWYSLYMDKVTHEQALYISHYCEIRNEPVPKFIDRLIT